MTKQRSKPDGGMLGHLCAFKGCVETTECGCLHGNFLIWLCGGLGLIDLHDELRGNDKFKKCHFEFFENIIHHHLPDMDTAFDRRVEYQFQRPPLPPSTSEYMPEQAKDLMK
jgi:hypothetical protein